MSWANVPAGTQSFFLRMHDMNLARNKTTDDQAHWVLWNIPATATGLPEGVPKGSQLPDGSFQVSATGPMYRGPGAAANGPFHHYVFELYALDTELDVKPSADAFESTEYDAVLKTSSTNSQGSLQASTMLAGKNSGGCHQRQKN